MNKILEGFEQDCRLRGQADSTLIFNIGEARRFCEFLGKDPTEASKADILAYLGYLREKNLKQTSIARMFSGLAVFYDYLEEMEMVEKNPVRPVRKRYLKVYKETQGERRAITKEEAAMLINSIIDTRDKAILILLLKTGIRRHELTELDVSDVDLKEMSIELKPTPKRTNRIVFFDEECAELLRRWLRTREVWNHNGCPALFISRFGERLSGDYIKVRIKGLAEKVGLHNPKSKRPQDRFTPHCCRHFFTTQLRKAGMPREFIQELRGDIRREAIDIYDHIDKKELKESYLAHIPQLGV